MLKRGVWKGLNSCWHSCDGAGFMSGSRKEAGIPFSPPSIERDTWYLGVFFMFHPDSPCLFPSVSQCLLRAWRLEVVGVLEGCWHKSIHNSPLSPASVLNHLREKKEAGEWQVRHYNWESQSSVQLGCISRGLPDARLQDETDFSHADIGRVGEDPINRRTDFIDKITTWLRAGQSQRKAVGRD